MAHVDPALAERVKAALSRCRDALPAQKAVPEKYAHIDFSIPVAVRENLKRGLALHRDGHSGDGLQADTVAWATRMARGEKISPEKAVQMRAWLARHESDRKPDWATEKTPGYVAWMLWGGDDAVGWSNKLVAQMEAADRTQKAADPAERLRAAMARCRDAAAARTQKAEPEVAPMAAPTERPPEELPPRLVDFGGVPVYIDRPKGFVQTKTDDNGIVQWARTYLFDYGYLAGTDGGDEEPLDVFLGPDPAAPLAWWIVQTRGHGVGFDEYKLMLGFVSEVDAKEAYLAHVPVQFFGSISPMPVDRLRALLGAPQSDANVLFKSAPNVAKLKRVAKALHSARTFKGTPRPASEAPEDLRAIVESAPLTWTYPNPEAVGGWLGAIEPENQQWIAFVDVAGKALLWTQRDEAGGVVGDPFLIDRELAIEGTQKQARIVEVGKAAQPDEQYVLGIVLEPDTVDLQGDVYTAEVIRRSAYEWLARYRNTDYEHKFFINDKIDVVESWVAPEDATIAGVAIKAGTWLLGAIVRDPELWAEVKAGKINGFSINGVARKIPLN